jgi:hypothetical protein
MQIRRRLTGLVFFFVVSACGAPSADAPISTSTGGGPGGSGPDPGTSGSGPGAPGSTDAGAGDLTAPLPGVARVWAIHDGEKIKQDDLTNPAAASNEAWDAAKIRLFGARNEIVAFQVIVESTSAGIHGLSARLPRLRLRGGTAEIAYAPPLADPTAYAGRPIEIFTEHYMNVTEASHASWVFTPGGPAAPADPLGWTPVQLVPENATPGRGGLPIDVAPKKNQALWIEVYTGRGLPAGTYDGVVTLEVGGVASGVPVELELHDFDLPDDPSMNAMIYFEPEQVDRYEGKGHEDRYHRFAHRQRVELVNAYDPASLAAAAGRFDGSDFAPNKGYAGPGESTGNRIAPATFYGPGTAYDTKPGAWKTADAWMTALATAAPNATTFLYMPDEPNSSDFGYIRTLANNVKSDPGPGRTLPTFVTTAYDASLDGAIDIWCAPPSSFDVTRVATERAKGHQMWFYNGRRPATGAVIIDAPATDPRSIPWAAFEYDVATYYYWHGDMWRHNAQKVGDRDQNVWLDPITFDNRGEPGKSDTGYIDGDGVLMYPGHELLHPDQDRGIDGPVSSIQLANLRRGLQDHQYLALARARGKTAAVTSALSAIVPHVFSDAGATPSFPQHGDAYEKARRALADAITAP